MKILVASDNHGDSTSLDLIVEKFPNMDLYLHAGDSEESEISIVPFISVRGNCDFYGDFPPYRIIPTPYGNLLIQHHPRFETKILVDNNIKICIHGHTHIRKNTTDNGRIILCPGSVNFSRDGNEQSFAILDISEKKCKIKFVSLND